MSSFIPSAAPKTSRYGDKIILVVTNEIKKIDNSISNTVDNIKYELLKIWQNTKDVFSKSIYTYSYISENPYINVDTDLLREYANRLAKLSSKINSVNKRMKTLYYNVGLVDLFNLIQADILANYNYKIDSCKNYLNNTANSFEEAERNIISSFE